MTHFPFWNLLPHNIVFCFELLWNLCLLFHVNLYNRISRWLLLHQLWMMFLRHRLGGEICRYGLVLSGSILWISGLCLCDGLFTLLREFSSEFPLVLRFDVLSHQLVWLYFMIQIWLLDILLDLIEHELWLLRVGRAWVQPHRPFSRSAGWSSAMVFMTFRLHTAALWVVEGHRPAIIGVEWLRSGSGYLWRVAAVLLIVRPFLRRLRMEINN